MPVAPEDRGLRRTRRLTGVFAWVTAVGALGAVAGAPGPGAARVVLAALILVVLAWWGSGRWTGSWWLVAAEAVVITAGCLVLPSPEPMLGLLFGTTTRRAVRAELGPGLVRAAPAFVGYLCGAFWTLVVAGDGVAPERLAPSLLPLLGLVIGTLALGDTVAAVGTAKTALRVSRDLQDRLRAQLEYDDLTGVASRTRLTELVDDALNHSAPGRRPALLLVDLDDFKDINDAYGHPTGDEFLVAAADQLRRTGAGVVGRLGGDEFAVLTDTDADGVDETVRVGERLLVALSETAPVAGLMARLRASVGVAVATGQPGESAAVLLRDADTAMYAAKRAGGNRVQVFHQRLRTTLLQRQRDEAELRCAVEREQFVLHFQPIVDLATGAVVGAEALVRWQHPDRGMLPPGPVIELAEETGLIVPLGNWVLGAACRQAVEWASAGFVIRMSVNVSARQLHTEDFVAMVADTLAETGLPPDRLTLELTESALIRPAALALLHDIRALGVRVALDDFGTGYSSLSYLQRHPFDLIKVDRSFVKQLGEVPTAEGIVRCILDLAAVLNTPVVGEGVETRSQAELLAASGCALAQGYYYGKPAPASDWTDLTVAVTPFRL